MKLLLSVADIKIDEEVERVVNVLMNHMIEKYILQNIK